MLNNNYIHLSNTHRNEVMKMPFQLWKAERIYQIVLNLLNTKNKKTDAPRVPSLIIYVVWLEYIKHISIM